MITNTKKRVHLTAAQKRKALIEVSRGKDIKEVFVNKTNSKDKKYSSKILYKCKKEVFSKKPDAELMDFECNMADIDIEFELGAFSFKNSNSDYYKNFKNNEVKYKKDEYIILSNRHSVY